VEKNPVAATPTSMKAAASLWSKHCLSCHGARGRGDGPNAKTLETKTPDFTDRGFMASRSDGELFRKLSLGKRPMPAYKRKLSEAQRWQLINLMRSMTDAK
jgi:mono/diheme cytochrome c family protein